MIAFNLMILKKKLTSFECFRKKCFFPIFKKKNFRKTNFRIFFIFRKKMFFFQYIFFEEIKLTSGKLEKNSNSNFQKKTSRKKISEVFSENFF